MNILDKISNVRDNIDNITDIRIKTINNVVLDYVEAEVNYGNNEAAMEFLIWAIDYYCYECLHKSFQDIYNELAYLIFNCTK